jgi:hypothetical protein
MSAALPFSSVAFSRSGVDFTRNLDSIDEWSRIFDQTQHYHYFYQIRSLTRLHPQLSALTCSIGGRCEYPVAAMAGVLCALFGHVIALVERIRVCIII